MKPVVTVAEMKAIDSTAPVPESVLIERAGYAVFVAAKKMMGGTYGRHVVVVAGKGNNGADGRVAADLLSKAGASVHVVEPGAAIPHADIVIDAAFGTGFHGEYRAPDVQGAPVLAVDIPSGINGDTGEACEGAVRADVTVTFAALKPGLLLGDGPDHAGRVEVADIGLDTSHVALSLLEASDVSAALPDRPRSSQKWNAALTVVSGSPGMLGAAGFVASAAQRAGAGMVRLGSPGVSADKLATGEAVAIELPFAGWSDIAIEASERSHAIVVGPGLGRASETVAAVRKFISESDLPMVIDGDALFALGEDEGISILKDRKAATVLTPHEGEFKRLAGHAPSEHRIADVQTLAAQTGAVVLLKGSTTVVASPNGQVLLSATGSSRLATAGSGDVLSGVMGAFLASGVEPAMAAACGALVHGSAAQLGHSRGLVAGDLPELVAEWLSANV